MVSKQYQWAEGAILEDHSRRKHKILREYFTNYLTVRCQLPSQSRFRFAIVDGFSGAGRYSCGAPGSPIIFLEELKNATSLVNLRRASRGLSPIEIECLLVLNDADNNVVKLLKENVTPIKSAILETTDKLQLRIEYFNEIFEAAYPKIKDLLSRGRYRSVLFNLDQCGHSHVDRKTLVDIMRSYPSTEIFYTFAIESLLAFLRKSEPELLATQLSYLRMNDAELKRLEGMMNKNMWLGIAERLVFESLRTCAQFVSPFSINNPTGWRYWLIHFANSYRARQVYNNILHNNSSSQAHFGRSGLNMLSYDPEYDNGALYLFGESDREDARKTLFDDIPRLVSEFGDAIGVSEFYESIYNLTPAHTDDVHSVIIENPDIEVITASGGSRKKPNTISAGDTLKLKSQRSFILPF